MTEPTINTDDKHTYVRSIYLSWPRGKGPALSIKGGTMAAPTDIEAVAANVDLRYTWHPADAHGDGYWSGHADVMVHRRFGRGWGERTRALEHFRHPEVKDLAERLLAEHHPRVALTITETPVSA